MADINFDCPFCSQNLEAPPDMAGEIIECPACSEQVQIPVPPDLRAAAEAAAAAPAPEPAQPVAAPAAVSAPSPAAAPAPAPGEPRKRVIVRKSGTAARTSAARSRSGAARRSGSRNSSSRQAAPERPAGNLSSKSRLAAFLLCWLLPGLGIHRFYVGKVGTGILYLLTLGGLGIWNLVDWIMILAGGFKDKQGLPVKNW